MGKIIKAEKRGGGGGGIESKVIEEYTPLVLFNRLSTGRSLQPSLKTTGEKIETTRKQQK